MKRRDRLHNAVLTFHVFAHYTRGLWWFLLGSVMMALGERFRQIEEAGGEVRVRPSGLLMLAALYLLATSGRSWPQSVLAQARSLRRSEVGG